MTLRALNSMGMVEPGTGLRKHPSTEPMRAPAVVMRGQQAITVRPEVHATSVVGTELCCTGSGEFPDYSTVENTNFGSPKTKPNGNDLQLMYKYRSDNLHCEVSTYTARSGPRLYKQLVPFVPHTVRFHEEQWLSNMKHTPSA